MKIGVVVPSSTQLESWGTWLALAFQGLNHETKQFAYRESAELNGVDGMNRQLRRMVGKWDSDLVVIVKGELISPQTLDALRKDGFLITLLANDDHQVLESVSLPLGRHCEKVFTFTSASIPRYAADGIPAEFMLFYADPRICAPAERRESLDVSFVGTYYPEREPLISLIAEKARLGFDLEGDGWASHAAGAPNEWAKAYFERARRPDYAQVLDIWRRSKICLNIHQDGLKKMGVVANLRCYELGAAGRFMVSDHVRGMEEAFGSPLPFKTLPDDWTDEEKHAQLEFWAKSHDYDETRADCASRFREKVLKEHTPTVRAKQILNSLKMFGTSW